MADNSRPPVTGYPAPPPGAYSNGYPPGAHSNASYPYAAPPPQYANYQYYAPDRRATFLRYFLVAMIAFFVIIGTVLFIVWLVLRPRLPEFRVQSLTVTNFSVSNSSQHVSGDWLVQFQVANPNKKMKISYADIASSIFYKSESLSATRLPPFDQGTRNQTVVQASFAAVDTYVDGWAVSEINAERARGAVSFQVRLLALARFKAGWWRARRRLIRVFCVNLAVGLPPNNGTGKLTGGVRECRVGL
ncbi:NDR1/HIN1-like protein 26 [Rhodamnia argentea]|uniref:NDR1/HIN1-like protein 26 n=1 Tax=Rhodamnia argentea TaxID=178133 RepID=A0A8B8NKQ7_9MYRT|nr:NDR1/HIN1-like protein 26 [Rhodamnia argentea]